MKGNPINGTPYKETYIIRGNSLFMEIHCQGRSFVTGNPLEWEIHYNGTSFIKRTPLQGETLNKVK